MITQERLKEVFDYKDGNLYWKVKLRPQMYIGELAGTLHKLNNDFRRTVGFERKTYLVSRLIFLYHHGYLPLMVDHIDRDTTNDKIENLRAATRCENSRNKTCAKNSSSKYLGVSLHKRDKKYYARIKHEGKLLHLGCFKNENTAALMYNRAAVKHYGEFANLNIINS